MGRKERHSVQPEEKKSTKDRNTGTKSCAQGAETEVRPFDQESGILRAGPQPTELPTCEEQSLFNRRNQQVKVCANVWRPVPEAAALGVPFSLRRGAHDSTSLLLSLYRNSLLRFVYCLGNIISLSRSTNIWHSLLFEHRFSFLLISEPSIAFFSVQSQIWENHFYLLAKIEDVHSYPSFPGRKSRFSLSLLQIQASLPEQVSGKDTEGTFQIDFLTSCYLHLWCREFWIPYHNIKILSQSLNNLKVRFMDTEGWELWLQMYLVGLMYQKELKREKDAGCAPKYLPLSEHISFMSSIHRHHFSASRGKKSRQQSTQWDDESSISSIQRHK